MLYRRFISFSLLFFSGLIYVNTVWFTSRTETATLLGSIFFLSVLFAIILVRAFKNNDGFSGIIPYQMGGLIFRLALLFCLPNLSDDYFRFLWDGNLNAMGVNPFLKTPESLSEYHNSGIMHELFSGMNSPQYHSVYTPLNQFIFQLAAIAAPQSIGGQVLVLKMVIFIGEILTILVFPHLLDSLGMNKRYALFYILNPLVIIECTGNLHFESLTISMLLVFIYFLIRNRNILAAVFFALAVQIKLLPLIFLPAIFSFIGWRKFLVLMTVLILVTSMFALPFLTDGFVSGYESALNLYFSRFEFNASIYYIIRWLGNAIFGYNIIQKAGPLLGIVATFLITAVSLRPEFDRHSFFRALFLSMLIYLLCTTTVHPWYVVNIIPLGIIAGFPVAVTTWSILVFGTYTTYGSIPYSENLLIVFMEYAIFLAVLILEIKTFKKIRLTAGI